MYKGASGFLQRMAQVDRTTKPKPKPKKKLSPSQRRRRELQLAIGWLKAMRLPVIRVSGSDCLIGTLVDGREIHFRDIGAFRQFRAHWSRRHRVESGEADRLIHAKATT